MTQHPSYDYDPAKNPHVALRTLKEALLAGRDPNAPYRDGRNMLSFAAPHMNNGVPREDSEALIDLLLERGADPFASIADMTGNDSLRNDHAFQHLFRRMVSDPAPITQTENGNNLLHVLGHTDARALSFQLKWANIHDHTLASALQRLAGAANVHGETPAHRLWANDGLLAEAYALAKEAEGQAEEDEVAKAWVVILHDAWRAQTQLIQYGARLDDCDLRGQSVMDLIVDHINTGAAVLFTKPYPVCAQIASEIERRRLEGNTPQVAGAAPRQIQGGRRL